MTSTWGHWKPAAHSGASWSKFPIPCLMGSEAFAVPELSLSDDVFLGFRGLLTAALKAVSVR